MPWPLRPRTPEQLERWLERARVGRWTPGLATLVLRRGEVVWERGLGLEDLGRPRPVDAETVFRWYSVTKTLTATAVLLLCEREGIDVDAPAHRLVPRVARFEGGDRVTLRHLLSHGSGIPSPMPFEWGGPPDEPPRPVGEMIDDVIARHPQLDFAPGRRLRYSNTAYLVLEELVGCVAGEPFEGLVRREILEPLGMAGTHFGTERIAGPGVAAGHEHLLDPRLAVLTAATKGQVRRMVAERHGRYLALHPFRLHGRGFGGLFGPVRDLAAFARALLAPPPWLARAREAMWTENNRDWRSVAGLGWFLGRHRGRRFVRHTGSAVGYRSELRLYPDDDLAVAVLVNTGGCRTEPIADAIAEAFCRPPSRP